MSVEWGIFKNSIVLTRKKNRHFPPKNINTPKSVTAIFELLITRGAWYKSVSIFFHYSYLLSSTGYKKFRETDWHQLFPSIENQHLNFGRWDTLSLLSIEKEKKSMSKHFKNRGGGFFLMCGKTLGPWEKLSISDSF